MPADRQLSGRSTAAPSRSRATLTNPGSPSFPSLVGSMLLGLFWTLPEEPKQKGASTARRTGMVMVGTVPETPEPDTPTPSSQTGERQLVWLLVLGHLRQGMLRLAWLVSG